MNFRCEELKSNIDFALITIREDEYKAVLSRFKPVDSTISPKRYAIGTVPDHFRGTLQVCIGSMPFSRQRASPKRGRAI